jgi:hypothetical protein
LDDDAIEGDLYRIDLDDHPNPASWAVSVRDANFIDDLEFEISKKAKAVLNSNTDVIGLPNKQGNVPIFFFLNIACVPDFLILFSIAEEFRKHWYAEYDEEDNTFLVPCCLMDKFTSFQIQFGNVVAVIPPEYWSHPRKTDTCCEMCRTHIGRSESDTDFVIGYALTNAYYTHFDAEDESIGLAMKKCQPDNGLELYEVNDDQ